MEKLYEWVRQIAYVMVLISVIMQLAAGKQYQKYIRLYMGIVLILFMLVPVFRIFGTDTTGFMTEAEKKYTEMVEQIETKSAELEEEDVEKSLEESEEEQTEAGRIESGGDSDWKIRSRYRR